MAASNKGDAVLLDLDAVGVGDPRDDLASWIADHLVEHPADSLASASEPLLRGYAGEMPGPGVRVDELVAPVGRALVERAAAGIRRLERGARERAIELVERARTLANEL